MAADGDDIVEQEIDVFLCKSLADQLYVFQYPNRPSSMTYDDLRILQARVKPKQQKVELELALNTKSPNYDHSKGEQIALNVDGRNPDEGAFFKGGLMNKQVLTSSKATSSTSRYAVGFLRGGELHLTPVHSIVQLRPAFQYLDRSDSRADAHNRDDTGSQEEEELTPVTVRFSNQNTERAKRARERSYTYLQQQRASEQWINLSYNPAGSGLSCLEKAKLVCPHGSHEASPFNNTMGEYLDALTSTLNEGGSDQAKASTSIRSLCLADQIKTLMTSAKVIRFKQLMELLPPNTDETVVARTLQQSSMLVQGCWVVKSDVLYPKDSFSPTTGIPSDILCKARDYVMWLYTESDVVTQKEVLDVVKIPLEDLKEILQQMGRPMGTKGWKFLYPRDEDFLKRSNETTSFKSVVDRQKMLWDARYQQLTRVLQIGQHQDIAKKQPTATRRRRKSARDSISDDAESGAEVEGGKAARKMEVLRVNGAHTSSLETRAEVLSAVHETLRAGHCVTQTQLRAALAERGITQEVLTDAQVDAFVAEAGGHRLNNKWPQNAMIQPVYVYTVLGDDLDVLREGVVSLFRKSARVSIGTASRKLQEEVGREASEGDCRRVLQDFCVGKAGFYYLKGTVADASTS